MWIKRSPGSAPSVHRSIEAFGPPFGFVPNLAAEMAAEPAALAAYLNILNGLASSGLSPVEQQLVMIAASHANEAPYNLAVHVAVALQLGGEPGVVQAAAGRLPVNNRRLEALRQFAEALSVGRGHDPLPDPLIPKQKTH